MAILTGSRSRSQAWPGGVQRRDTGSSNQYGSKWEDRLSERQGLSGLEGRVHVHHQAHVRPDGPAMASSRAGRGPLRPARRGAS